MHLSSLWEVKKVQKACILVWALSILTLWFCCCFFPKSASSELAVQSNPTPIPLCSLWRWKRAFIFMENELSSCWWLCNPKIWLLELFCPPVHKLCHCCLEERPWKWQERLCACSWCVTDVDCCPRHNVFGYAGSGASGCHLPEWVWFWRWSLPCVAGGDTATPGTSTEWHLLLCDEYRSTSLLQIYLL